MMVKRVSDAELDTWYDRPFNPPTPDSLQTEEFSEEYWAVHAQIGSCLEKLGAVMDCMVGDFVMNDDREDSRWISVELVNAKLAKKETVNSILDVLNNLSERYAVAITHEEPEQPLFFLIITSDLIVASDVESDWLNSLLEEVEAK